MAKGRSEFSRTHGQCRTPLGLDKVLKCPPDVSIEKSLIFILKAILMQWHEQN